MMKWLSFNLLPVLTLLYRYGTVWYSTRKPSITAFGTFYFIHVHVWDRYANLYPLNRQYAVSSGIFPDS